MLEDIQTVVWKEWREWLLQPGNLRVSVFRQLFLLAMLGIFIPVQLGKDWITSAAPLIYAVWVSMFLTTTLVADAIAGERERHTLETLLASRLPNGAILYGKIAAVAGYAWIITVLGAAMGWIAVNVLAPEPGILEYPLLTTWGIVILSALGAMLAAAAGTWVSLRAPTVKQAQQSLSIALMLLILVPVVGLQLFPASWQAHLSQLLVGMGHGYILGLLVAVLMVVDTALLAAARARFQRNKLILD